MEFSLDDLLEEVDGDTQPRISRPKIREHRLEQQRSSARTTATSTSTSTMTTTETRTLSIVDDFDSDSDSPRNTTTAVDQGDGVDPKPRFRPTTTAPVPATNHDATHLPPAPETAPATVTAMDVDFDSDVSPTHLTVVVATGTAADVDFDSDSLPSAPHPAVTEATGTAADVDFDSDSSATTPAQPVAAGGERVGFDLEIKTPTKENGANNNNNRNGEAEELLRLASEVEEEEGGTETRSEPLQLRQETGDAKRKFEPAPSAAGDDTERSTVKPSFRLQTEPSNSGEAVVTSAYKRRRCGTVYLGGAASDRGFCASSLSQRACDNLRCTDCNFEVLRFDAQEWDETTIDYMFLRNNAPDPVKLGARLLDCQGACAYACQCSWQTAKELRVLSQTERPRWACGGHN